MAKQQQISKRKPVRKGSGGGVDTRTPSGKVLPY